MDMKFDNIEDWKKSIQNRFATLVEEDELLQLAEMVLRKKINYDFMDFVKFDESRINLMVCLETDMIAAEIGELVLKEEINLKDYDCYDVEELLELLML
jgi:hypothetical protein